EGLHINKTVLTSGSIEPGEIVTFQIEYYNENDDKATDVMILDNLPDPEYFTFKESFPPGDYEASSNTITWDKTNLPSLEALGSTRRTIIIDGWAGKKYTGSPNHNPDNYYLPATGD